MRSTFFTVALAALAGQVSAAGVTGKPEGFAAATTGGGSATCAEPGNIATLTTWLTDSTARCILISKEYNFIGSEGTATESGCRPASNKCPGNGGQDAIDHADWCTNGNAGAGSKTISVTYDKAGNAGINLGSNKSLVGVGSSAVIRGKGIRIANGAKNVIIQNIHFTEINPQYIWGGDAITLAGSDLIWIDHIKVSLTGRQQLVTGPSSSGRVTVSNSEFDGQTSWSSTCDNRHYWSMYFTGSGDLVTLMNNYIHHTSGRSPKMTGSALVHAVGNYWYSNSGHAFDIGSGSMVLAEGNTFSDVTTPLLENLGALFSSPTSSLSSCSSYLGHACVANVLTSSGAFAGSATSFFGSFKGYTAASTKAASANVALTAGIGKL